LDFRSNFVQYFDFIISLFGIVFNVFYQVDCEGEASSVAHFSLTLILLTWRIWRAPNNASKWQMGFNSAFKGLMYKGDLKRNAHVGNTA
jgi:hypothetical protein